MRNISINTLYLFHEELKLNDSKGSVRSERLSSAEVEGSSERSSLTYSENTFPREADVLKEPVSC